MNTTDSDMRNASKVYLRKAQLRDTNDRNNLYNNKEKYKETIYLLLTITLM